VCRPVASLVSLLFLVPRTRRAVPWLQIRFTAAPSERKTILFVTHDIETRSTSLIAYS
jgi:hypothetical protein